MQPLNWAGAGLMTLGCACLGFAGLGFINAASFQRHAGQALDQQLIEREIPTTASHTVATSETSELIGRLEIPRLHLSVIVMDGDDNATLAKAVGHVPGTAFPWESGNAVMAGHRDTFFLPLKDLRDGDAIRMTTVRGTFDYQVIRTQIVDPDDVSVLSPTPFRSLTLVTCYPFTYVGRAPKRLVIQAW